MLQRLIPDKHLSRAFGVLESLYMAGEGLGAFLASLLVLALGPQCTLVVAGVLLPTAPCSVAVPSSRSTLVCGSPRARWPSSAGPVSSLRSLTPMLERVARNLVPIAAIPGIRR